MTNLGPAGGGIATAPQHTDAGAGGRAGRDTWMGRSKQAPARVTCAEGVRPGIFTKET